MLTNQANNYRNILITRAKLFSVIRHFMQSEDFLEVDTPILGINKADALVDKLVVQSKRDQTDFSLRLAPERYLKQLLALNIDKIYELGKSFRDERSALHLQEFTSLECFAKHFSEKEITALCEKLIEKIVVTVKDTHIVPFGNDEINFKTPFYRESMRNLILDRMSLDVYSTDLKKLRNTLLRNGINYYQNLDWGECVEVIFDHFVRPTLVNPTFVSDYPSSVSAGSQIQDKSKGRLAERCELFISGIEVANSLKDETNFILLKKQLEVRAKRIKKHQNKDAQVDTMLLKAAHEGLPEMAGFGLGIDRLMMILLNVQNINSVLLFNTEKYTKE